MYLTISKFEREVKECKETLMDALKSEIDLQDMEDEALHAIQACLNMFDVAIEFTVEQAKTIDKINDKLDRVIRMLENQG